jgi:hypothetical protein
MQERERAWLSALAALVFVAGATAGLLLRPDGHSKVAAGIAGGRPAATRQAVSPGPATSAKPPAITSPATTGASPAGSGSTAMAVSPSPSASPSMSPSMAVAASRYNCAKEQPGNGTSGPRALAGVLADANRCSVPRFLVPAVKCKPGTPATTPGEQAVTCLSPAPHIFRVTFRTYPTLRALYGAYTSSVSSLDGTGTVAQNTRASCGATGAAYAEAGWNHQAVHPRQYSVAQMAAGKVPQLSAMGRLACFSNGKWRYLVWTTDVGRMLAVVTGTGLPSGVYNWWASLHHVIIFPGTEMCGMPDRMNSVPLGNLIQVPACPAGAGTTAG